MEKPEEQGEKPNNQTENTTNKDKLKTIVLFIHPEYANSVRNKYIIEYLRKFDNVTIRDINTTV